MCGIAGLIGVVDIAESRVERMLEVQKHRGPNASRILSTGKVVLGHNRLSIIDLNDRSSQPMIDAATKVAIVFNGEIYNYKSLKTQLDYNFQTESDTEVLLASYLEWGGSCVEKLEGMFSFVIHDPVQNLIFGARDRLGIKPFYFSEHQDFFIFASEQRAILESGLVDKKINQKALSEFLVFQHNFQFASLLTGTKELPPGNTFEIDLASNNFRPELTEYWNSHKLEVSESLTAELAAKKVKSLLFNSVEQRLVADVPFGAFLSGGMDSAAMVGIMAQVSAEPVHTFNVNFSEPGYGEAEYASQIAKRWGTAHTQLDLKPSDFLNLVPDAFNSVDFPGADGVNSWVVSKLVKEAGITMAISGTGGDELFGGYPIFKRAHQWSNSTPIRRIISPISNFPLGWIKNSKLHNLIASLNQSEEHLVAVFRQRMFEREYQECFNREWPAFLFSAMQSNFKSPSIYSEVSKLELSQYLRSVLLRDTDQMSMAHSLEVRVPFLDHKLVEFMLSLPDEYKQGKGNKPLLHKALGKEILPDNIVHRKKMGFVFPWERWLHEDLAEIRDQGFDHLKNFGALSEKEAENVLKGFSRGRISFPVIIGLMSLGYWMHKNEIRA